MSPEKTTVFTQETSPDSPTDDDISSIRSSVLQMNSRKQKQRVFHQ